MTEMQATIDLGAASGAGVTSQRRPASLTLKWVLLLFATDVAAFAIVTYLAAQIVIHAHHLKPFTIPPIFESSVMVILFQLLIFERLGLYRRSFALSIRDEFYSATTALAIGSAPLLIIFTVFPLLSSSRLIILLSLVFSTLAVGATRASIHLARSAGERRRPRRIAIVGRTMRASVAARSLQASAGVDVLRIDVEDLDESVLAATFSGDDLSIAPWFAQARAWGCDTLMLTEALPPQALPLLLHAAARNRMTLAFAPPRFRVHAYSAKLEVFGEQVLLVFGQLKACTQQADLLKRIFDVAFASFVLLVTAPIVAVCLMLMLAESRGPLLYRQERIGRNGKPFQILKLRSMRIDAERETGPVWASRGDSRVTRVGRFLRRTSLDEIPQLVNVLRGEMSIVGPRPERSTFVEQFRASIPRYDERHLVRPGLTGWSQVNMRRALTPSAAGEKLSYDLFYIEQWSLFLDFSIVAKTAFEFLLHDAA